MKKSAIQMLLTLNLSICSFPIFAQNDCIECYNTLNQIDRIIQEKDTITAIFIYEAIDKEKCIIRKGRHLKYSKIYYEIDKIVKSKEELIKSTEKGLFGGLYFNENYDYLLSDIKIKYGKKFLEEVLSINQKMTKEAMNAHGDLIKEIKNIYDTDQFYRKNKKYKDCKNYNFIYRLGFPYDTTKNHVEMMLCFEEFRQKDSILLKRFVDIVDSLTYTPTDDIIFGMFPINPIINHTAHFNFEGLDNHYLNSVKLGTLSPEVYAWYQGYYEEYYQLESKLYFTKGEKTLMKFESEKINQINRRRLELGLPLCPAVVWNTKMY